MLVFAAMNLKKLATWLWKGKEPLFFCSKIRNEVDKKLFQARVTSLEQLFLSLQSGAVTKVLSQPFFQINGFSEVASSEISRNFTKI